MASVLCEAASAPTAEHTDEVGMWPTRAGVAMLGIVGVGDAAVPRARMCGSRYVEHILIHLIIMWHILVYFSARWSTHGVGACVTEAP